MDLSSSGAHVCLFRVTNDEDSLSDANGIKPGSNSKMTDKHTAEHSDTRCLGADHPVCDLQQWARSINNLERNAIFVFLGNFYARKL